MDQYFEHLNNVAITVCDAEGYVVDMNQHSADVNSHGHKIIGNNLMDCHPEPAKTKLKGLLEHQQMNAYTIEKILADTGISGEDTSSFARLSQSRASGSSASMRFSRNNLS